MSYRIGIIGMGLRMTDVFCRLAGLRECELAAVADPDAEGVRARMRDVLKWDEPKIDSVPIYAEAQTMLEREALDGVMVGTRCSAHAHLAAMVIRRGIPMFLEKPIAVSAKGLTEIEEALAVHPEMNDKTVVSFPLRLTEQVQMLREIVDSGKIGTVEHVQAVNDVPYGRVYFHGWYRDEKETGGLWLQKATHDFDYINSILRIRPVEICAMTSKQIFKGDKPAGKLCDECEEKQTCPESYVSAHRAGEYLYGPWCCFAEDTGNEDSGSAIIRYETGMHVVYSQNFFARKGAGLRGARFLGYAGTAEFDFQSGDVRVFMHHVCRTETYHFDAKDGHGGGDEALCRNFTDVVAGRARSRSSLRDGILSVNMCLAAKESSEHHRFAAIKG